ncbi:paraquat-inducible protein A [Stappia sp.]|uniref:paraquat-inducible protein A n=1 Tax=Stappia sp. TaxID=1870903 RepID=UPI0032D9691C
MSSRPVIPRLAIAVLLPVATFSFALGLVLPLMRFERLFLLEDRPSLLDIVAGLWRDGDAALATVIAAVSIVFPALKILLVHVTALTGARTRPLAVMNALGKWSMMDVMLVALVIFAAKSSGLAAAATLPGLWFYATATFATALAATLARRAG